MAKRRKLTSRFKAEMAIEALTRSKFRIGTLSAT